ncbi:gp118 (endogenous virus) [Lactococcus phage KSY1]|uniref:Gp118 n=1 Tax=Lactococcus phage KSY1 TaxID=2913972 RepID=A6MAI3_9CAUD|nr:gp118 [Lactococcus phage KSY1]ABG21661.1 gp118 [Lactococcus phage KSY1]
MGLFKRKPKTEPKPIMARFIYHEYYKENMSTWQLTNTRELKRAISDNNSMWEETIKRGNLYQPSQIVQGFETKEL